MLDIIRRLTKYINLRSSIDFTKQLGVSSGAAAAVSCVHLRSDNTPWRRLLVQRIVDGKRHPGPCNPDLDSLRLRNPLQGYHWLELVRQPCMTSRSATRRFRGWHSCPERELLPFRPLLQHRRLDGKPPVQGLPERDSRSGSRSSVHCSDDRNVQSGGGPWGEMRWMRRPGAAADAQGPICALHADYSTCWTPSANHVGTAPAGRRALCCERQLV